MEIITIKEDENTLSLMLKGRLDTMTAMELEAKLKADLKEKEHLEFDFQELEYVSSAGLRVLLTAQKVMNRQGTMVIRNVSDSVMEVFEMTGFVDILDIE